MALLKCEIYSGALDMCTSVNVVLPQKITLLQRPEKYAFRTLYLLHGHSDDQNAWTRNTSIERYAAQFNIAVVMPTVHRSWYADTAYGLRYWTYVSEELPALMGSWFPLSRKRENTFVAGLSMGGYGAFKLALRNPEKFAAAASLSGAVDILWPAKTVKTDMEKERNREFLSIFGTVQGLRGSDNDLFALASQRARKKTRLPRLYFHCGTEDFLYQDNVRFRQHLENLKLSHTYEEGPGEHEWGLWDRQIQRVLEWMLG
ncbi:MAG: alpha/beta hydrolase family protein [Fibrobacterota bacterium]